MSIVTGRGDEGFTDLMYGRRVPKTDPRVAAYGAVDELNAALGRARHSASESGAEAVKLLQEELVVVMGELATHPEDRERYRADGFKLVDEEMVEAISERCRRVEEELPPRSGGWAVPGDGSPAAADLDVARTICRRSELGVAGLLEAEIEPNRSLAIWLNRVSDYLWLLARGEEKG